MLLTPLIIILFPGLYYHKLKKELKLILKSITLKTKNTFFSSFVYLQYGLRNILVTHEIMNINQTINLIGAILAFLLSAIKIDKFYCIVTLIMSVLFLIYLIIASLKLS